MKTTTVETSKLSGAALDWAVAKAVGHVEGELHDDGYWSGPDYSTNWSQGGPLIGAHCALFSLRSGLVVVASVIDGEGEGPTHLIAACRAIVAAELGDEVEVPGELVG